MTQKDRAKEHRKLEGGHWRTGRRRIGQWREGQMRAVHKRTGRRTTVHSGAEQRTTVLYCTRRAGQRRQDSGVQHTGGQGTRG
jgi:hypothetical protein